jgi:hypothetical protein
VRTGPNRSEGRGVWRRGFVWRMFGRPVDFFVLLWRSLYECLGDER